MKCSLHLLHTYACTHITPCPLQGLRAQIDREQYRRNMQNELSSTKGLTIIESSVEDLVMVGGEGKPKVAGVSLGEVMGGDVLW